MSNDKFPVRKRKFFCHGKEIKGLRGGVLEYAAQEIPQIDTARAKKDRFRMETRLGNPFIRFPAQILAQTFHPLFNFFDGVGIGKTDIAFRTGTEINARSHANFGFF